MGRTGSSSKKKYSKKKSLKVSSEGRRLKKSKRTKSKKLRRHDDSYSSSPSDNDDSPSSSPLSSSSSEHEHKSRKSRSRTRIELKGSKKRTRKRSCSEDSSNDSDSPPVKKRKRSKKTKKKKRKHRKDSYISSESESCSTSGDDTIKGKSGNRKNRSRHKRSVSPYDDDYHSIENVMVENNPRRLKSVITVVTKQEIEEEDDMKRDEFKEEMVYDHDYDYDNDNDNDSNDGEIKKELVVDNTSVISKEKESNDSTDNKLETGVDDLESILRKKALENLSRFRGGIQTKRVTSIDNNKQNNENVSQPIIQRSRFTWRRDDASVSKLKEEKTSATYSVPESTRSQPPVPKLESATGLSVENKITNETHENIEVKQSTVDVSNNEVKESTVGVETQVKEGSSKGTNNDSSQFEKKTMSVMRGGEMVQVSYKVYIPNRAPALARRQLKR